MLHTTATQMSTKKLCVGFRIDEGFTRYAFIRPKLHLLSPLRAINLYRHKRFGKIEKLKDYLINVGMAVMENYHSKHWAIFGDYLSE